METIDIIRVALPATTAYLRVEGGAVFGIDGRRTDVSRGELDAAMRTLARLGVDISRI